jgi:PEP-CTERM motif
MKRNIFIAVLGVAVAGAAYGQGQINFSNYYNSHQTTGITYGGGPDAGMGVGNEISVELVYGASAITDPTQLTKLTASLTPVGWNGVTSPAPLGTAFGNYAGSGVFSGGAFVVPGTAGSTYAFALYASGTLSGVLYTGYSNVFTGATQATASAGIPNLPAGLMQETWSVNPVPEPTAMALGGLGMAALMLFRRKKV